MPWALYLKAIKQVLFIDWVKMVLPEFGSTIYDKQITKNWDKGVCVRF